MDNKEKLLEIFNNDPFGLLEVKSNSSARTPVDRLIASFEEINDFYEKNTREPQKATNPIERSLYSRLNGIKEDLSKAVLLKEYDRFNLLGDIDMQIKDDTIEVNSIDDIFNNDNLGLLDDNTENDIFTLKHISKKIDMPSNRARGKPCKDFEKFEHLFKEVQHDLSSGKRKLLPFSNEQDIEQGSFFILKGVMVYIAEKGEKEKSKGKINARLRCIFENGTESNLLLRSLSRELYRDGRRISETNESILEKFSKVTEEDEETGFIYVLRSLSSNPKITTIQNLYKIGFSRVPVEDRVKNAAKDPTFLMEPVAIVEVYKCFNMNPQKLEKLLHQFFGNNCLDIEIYDSNGKLYKPREWFIAPLDIIEQVITLIISGDITYYKYDDLRNEIISR